MTKIKDLVTVTVDSVFRSFPVDEERYELIVTIREYLRDRENGLFGMRASDGNYVYEYLQGMEENLALGAAALALTSFSGYPRDLPAVVEDRAVRCHASLETHEYRQCLKIACDQIELKHELMTVLWAKVLSSVIVQEFKLTGFSVVSKTKG